MKKIYKKLLSIDMPLVVAELTNYGENLKEIPWSGKHFEFDPYCVFALENDLLTYYYDQEGIDWKINEAGKVHRNEVIEKSLKMYDSVKLELEKGEGLEFDDFKKFIKKLKEGWTWWDLMWWAIEYADRNNLPDDELLKVRKYTEHLAPGVRNVIRKSIEKMLPEKKEFVDALLLDEILSGNLPSDDVLRERQNGWVFTDYKLFNNLDEVSERFNIEFEKASIEELNTKELKGQTAFRGLVKGVVRWVENMDDVRNFKDGEIIFSSTTTPDFLPAMRKAKAILSEHGGMICHASITSRELKIPCVVGIKNLTKILKTGDEVEVDANEGVVRIIKKYKVDTVRNNV